MVPDLELPFPAFHISGWTSPGRVGLAACPWCFWGKVSEPGVALMAQLLRRAKLAFAGGHLTPQCWGWEAAPLCT